VGWSLWWTFGAEIVVHTCINTPCPALSQVLPNTSIRLTEHHWGKIRSPDLTLYRSHAIGYTSRAFTKHQRDTTISFTLLPGPTLPRAHAIDHNPRAFHQVPTRIPRFCWCLSHRTQPLNEPMPSIANRGDSLSTNERTNFLSDTYLSITQAPYSSPSTAPHTFHKRLSNQSIQTHPC
jgi:hypothetical protein